MDIDPLLKTKNKDKGSDQQKIVYTFTAAMTKLEEVKRVFPFYKKSTGKKY